MAPRPRTTESGITPCPGFRVTFTRLRAFNVTGPDIRVSTLDSWAKALVEAFPSLAGYETCDEVNWDHIRMSALQLLANSHVQRILCASYGRVVVDEYQDCNLAQHALVMALSDLCPAVILGDPLQAIFTFGGSLVDWQADLANFPQVQVPVFPWRWHQRNELLGEFLTDVRLRLENGQPINLAGSPVGWRANSPTETYGACMNAAGLPGDVVVLRKWPHEVPGLARRLGGAFGVMEELEAKLLSDLADALQHPTKTGLQKAVALLQFVRDCFSNLPAGVAAKQATMEGGSFPGFQVTSALGPLLVALRNCAEEPESAQRVAIVFDAADALEATIIRREAWHEMRRAVKRWRDGSSADVAAAVREVRDHTRIVGRRAERRVVSRVVLVKGQQFQNCVVVGADDLTRCELYVAMTRPTHRLVVVSNSPTLNPVV